MYCAHGRYSFSNIYIHVYIYRITYNRTYSHTRHAFSLPLSLSLFLSFFLSLTYSQNTFSLSLARIYIDMHVSFSPHLTSKASWSMMRFIRATLSAMLCDVPRKPTTLTGTSAPCLCGSQTEIGDEEVEIYQQSEIYVKGWQRQGIGKGGPNEVKN